MLKTHMDLRESVLLEQFNASGVAGHSLNKGTPREIFIHEFLEQHLSSTVHIGRGGEIMNAASVAGETRNQHDIVIYDPRYPKINLSFGTTHGINAYLAESVIATIEIKSALTEEDILQAARAARNAKQMQRHIVRTFWAGHIPPSILNFVVAYAGPAKLATVVNWITKSYDSLGFEDPRLSDDPKKRCQTSSAAIDGIFLLGKGFCLFDNMPTGFVGHRKDAPQTQGIAIEMNRGSLLMLFVVLLSAISNTQSAWLDAKPYLASFQAEKMDMFGWKE